MKLDMHCHVKEGSIDSKVSLDEYITLLKERGFDGMLITDHDTYKGYRHWKYQNSSVLMHKINQYCNRKTSEFQKSHLHAFWHNA